ncbi:glycosyltransferase [Embleya hyalina]|uniref:Glycosyl transferase n=1 Tax=Embleya hyalina TaxID=516124 RepID=A0A401Z343_9ACTN|nr:nucleotide disphospho-sugar-binding domain-containing protein [Embleya hyalina]GCE01277.1 glycosyl transferase [Embleya hyalina]
MRFMFVVPPFAGHVNPTVAVAAALTERGHEAVWCGPPEILDLLPLGARLFATADSPGAPGGYARLHARWQRLRGVGALRFLVEETLVPLAHTMLPGVAAAVAGYRPDVVVADQQTFAGAFAAVKAGIPWATSATTSAEFTRPLVGFPKIDAWVRTRIAETAVAAGVPGDCDPRFSPRLVLVFSTPELVGPTDAIPAHHRYVGPAFGRRPATVDFPWDRLDPDRRHVLVSLGTLNRDAGDRFYPAVVAATRPLADRVQLILAAPERLAGPPAEHVLVREFVPQPALLPHLDAVVTHGGHNTVCEALAFGLPLVLAPIRDDQPIVARQVVVAGAGVRVRFGRAHVPELRAAVTDVLDRPELRAGAARIRASFAAAGGADAAAERLEELC